MLIKRTRVSSDETTIRNRILRQYIESNRAKVRERDWRTGGYKHDKKDASYLEKMIYLILCTKQ